MSNANKITRYLTTIDSAPSYAINILVVKPMTVAATSFFIHTLLKLNDKKLGIEPFVGTQTFLRLTDGDTLYLLSRQMAYYLSDSL